MKARSLLYPLRVLKQIANLPKTSYLDQQEKKTLRSGIDSLRKEAIVAAELLERHDVKIKDITELLRTIDNRVASIKQTINKATLSSTPLAIQDKPVNNTISDDHSLDFFYKLFEDRFRGTEDDIRKRIEEYTPQFQALNAKLKKKPVIDLGCGRGEFLDFAKNLKLKAIGIDMNYDMVERAKALGFDAVQTDAISYMLEQKDNSIAAVTGFHIVEHIPFDALMRLFEECYRSIASGGFILFETPNPKNLIIGTNNFYIDPSHIKPIPPELLAFALESVGFRSEILPTHPLRAVIKHKDKEVEALMKLVYGPQDYAVIARKM